MPSDIRVCFVGDSFVAGVGDPEHRGWVGRLAARGAGIGQPLTTYNLVVRRETSRDVLTRWRAECSLRLFAGVDGRVVVSFGVNDATHEGTGPRVPLRESITNLTALLRDAHATDWPVLVVGPPPVDDDGHNRRTGELDEGFAQVCASATVPYVSVLTELLACDAWRREVQRGDGAHPAAAGYPHLADIVWPTWTTWLERPQDALPARDTTNAGEPTGSRGFARPCG